MCRYHKKEDEIVWGFFFTVLLILILWLGYIFLQDYIARRRIRLYGEEVRKTIVIASERGIDVAKAIHEMNSNNSYGKTFNAHTR